MANKRLNDAQKRELLQQIMNTTPDAKTADRAREVLRTRAVTGSVSIGGDLIFGQCVGAAPDRTVYNISIDLSTYYRGGGGRVLRPTMRCSCPSRVFPCKHMYALLLLYLGTYQGANTVCALMQPLPDWLGDARKVKRNRMMEEKMQRCAITDRLTRGTLAYFDASIAKTAQGDVKDTLEDMLLLPLLPQQDNEVFRTRVFMAVLLTAKILLARLSGDRPWKKGAETRGTMKTKERELEEALRQLDWDEVQHRSAPNSRLYELVQHAANTRIVATTTHQLGGREERDRRLLDVDEAERNAPVCDLALELLTQAAPFLNAPVLFGGHSHDHMNLPAFGDLFASMMEKGDVGWASRVEYVQVLLRIVPENQDQWRKMTSFELHRYLNPVSFS